MVFQKMLTPFLIARFLLLSSDFLVNESKPRQFAQEHWNMEQNSASLTHIFNEPHFASQES